MTLAPLLAATPTIQLHAFAAIAAFALGLIQLAAPKGTFPHRLTGWVWAALMQYLGRPNTHLEGGLRGLRPGSRARLRIVA